MLSAIDSNVLVYALDVESEYHSASRNLLDRAKHSGAELCLTPQNLAELFSVLTNPRRVRAPRSISEAMTVLHYLLALPGLSLLPVPLDLVTRWMNLVVRKPFSGRRVFDLQLIATLLANGITRFYTFNVKDFEFFEELEVRVPTSLW